MRGGAQLGKLRDGGVSRPPTAATVLVASVDSTNALARRIAREYANEGGATPAAWIVAERQHAGRGRRGSRWASARGGIYLTRIVPLMRRELALHLPMLAAVVLAECLEPHLDARCGLKWPNDLMVGGAKIGGVLIEVLAGADAPAVALVGCGVNHRRQPVPGRAVTSVEEHCRTPPSRLRLTGELMAGLDRGLAGLADREGILARYVARSLHRPGDVLVCRAGDEQITGVFTGFDARGGLRLAVDGDERTLTSGEILERHPLRG